MRQKALIKSVEAISLVFACREKYLSLKNVSGKSQKLNILFLEIYRPILLYFF